jgi:hypothetical protein
MGTTLTGTTPQDTYDSLIKVTDNGPLSGTAKYLSDGLGNDSILALSTTALGIGTASPTSLAQLNGTAGTAHLRVSEAGATIGFLGGANGIVSGATGSMALRAEAGLILSSQGNAQTMTLTSAGNVGIGTSSPTQTLDVAGRVAAAGADYHSFAVASGTAQVRLERTGSSAGINYIGSDSDGLHMMDSAFAKKATFTSNGLTFNGDTAAANALDDYEEGTWTPSFRGTTTAGTYTYSSVQAGAYTKIGNQVTVWCSLIGITASSAGTGEWLVAGLPFTIANNDSMSRNNTTAWIRLANASRSNILALPSQGGGGVAFVYDANSLGNTDFTIASDFSDGLQIGFSFTYFV